MKFYYTFTYRLDNTPITEKNFISNLSINLLKNDNLNETKIYLIVKHFSATKIL